MLWALGDLCCWAKQLWTGTKRTRTHGNWNSMQSRINALILTHWRRHVEVIEGKREAGLTPVGSLWRLRSLETPTFGTPLFHAWNSRVLFILVVIPPMEFTLISGVAFCSGSDLLPLAHCHGDFDVAKHKKDAGRVMTDDCHEHHKLCRDKRTSFARVGTQKGAVCRWKGQETLVCHFSFPQRPHPTFEQRVLIKLLSVWELK